MKTAPGSSIRRDAQRKLLRRTLKEYAPRVRMAGKFLLHAARDLLQIEQELKEAFAYAIGDANHELNDEATFQPKVGGGVAVDFVDVKDFAKHIIQDAEEAERYREIGDDDETEIETGEDDESGME